MSNKLAHYSIDSLFQAIVLKNLSAFTMFSKNQSNQSNSSLQNYVLNNAKKRNFLHYSCKGWSFVFIALYLVFFIYLVLRGPIPAPDTGTYLNYSPLRSAVYPMILKANSFLFGRENFNILYILQIIFGLLSVLKITTTLRRLFEIDNLTLFLMTLVFFLPYGPSKFGNYILTEGICYPFFLWAIACLLEGVFGKNREQNLKELLKFLVWTVLLVLTRKQFLFLFPAYAAVIGYLWFYPESWLNTSTINSKSNPKNNSKSNSKNYPSLRKSKITLLIACLLVSFLTTNIVERSLHYIEFKKFSMIPFTGIQLIIAPLFLAEASDEKLFDDPLEKKIFKLSYAKMQENKFNWQREDDGRFNSITLYHFLANYNNICWQTLAPILNTEGLDPYQSDALTLHMAFPLIFEHLDEYMLLMMMNIILNSGGFYLTLFFIGLTILAFKQHFLPRIFGISGHDGYSAITKRLSLLWLISYLLSCGNYLLISLVEPLLVRYTTYTEVVQVAVLFTFAMYALKPKARVSNSADGIDGIHGTKDINVIQEEIR